MNKLRTFIGIKLDLSDYQKNIKKFFDKSTASQIKWTREDNLHLTFFFIGSIEFKYIKEISNTLRKTISNNKSFTIHAGKCGCFIKRRKNCILWLDILENNDLLNLQQQIVEALIQTLPLELNIKHEDYVPHITVARYNKRIGIDVEALNNYLGDSHHEFNVNKVAIFESRSTPNGVTYIPIESIYLK